MNDGQYLELCNDLKQQYERMKMEHSAKIAQKNLEIAEKDELIEHLKSLLQSQPHKRGQFDSIRPSADIARYCVMGMFCEFD